MKNKTRQIIFFKQNYLKSVNKLYQWDKVLKYI